MISKTLKELLGNMFSFFKVIKLNYIYVLLDTPPFGWVLISLLTNKFINNLANNILNIIPMRKSPPPFKKLKNLHKKLIDDAINVINNIRNNIRNNIKNIRKNIKNS